MLKGACYVRVSTDNQLENYSIEEQTDRLKAYCKAKDIAVVRFYTDGGYSGGNTNRPALQQLLSDITAGEIDAVIVYKLDRLSRSQKDTLMLIEDKFLENGVDFISINENFDTSTPFGRAMIGILSVFAQLEKDQITERFTMGRIGRAKNGYFHGGAYAPVGYDYVDGKLEVNAYEAIQVRDLYNRFSKGYPLHNCWNYMQQKYTNKYGSWSSETLVRNVLKNEIYLGKVKFKGEVYDGIHEPIIPEELFLKVQKIFAHSKRDDTSFTRSPFKATTLLSGMIYCGKCGARCHAEHGNYSCYSRTKSDKKYIVNPACKNKKWKIKDLDALIIKFISELNFEEPKPKAIEAPATKDYKKRLTEIDRQIGKLIDLYQLESIPIDTISKKINLLTKEKNILMQEVQTDHDDSISNANKIAIKNCFLSLLDRGSLEEKRACLTNIIDRIILTDEDVEIILK